MFFFSKDFFGCLLFDFLSIAFIYKIHLNAKRFSSFLGFPHILLLPKWIFSFCFIMQDLFHYASFVFEKEILLNGFSQVSYKRLVDPSHSQCCVEKKCPSVSWATETGGNFSNLPSNATSRCDLMYIVSSCDSRSNFLLCIA